MLLTGILNPALLELLGRFRHTNTLVIADRGFPSWPGLNTVDISLVDDVPTVDQVLAALLPVCQLAPAPARMAEEFTRHASAAAVAARQTLFAAHGVNLIYEPHGEFKRRVPAAIGLIRTADTTPYANILLESA